MFSFSVMPRFSTSPWRSATAFSPLVATASARSSTRATKSGDLATKSVSHRSSTAAATDPVLGPAGRGLGVLRRRLQVGLGRGRPGVPPAGDVPALVHGLGDDVAHQCAGADGVVVARDDVLNDVGVAVAVDHSDDRQPELV